MPWVRAAVSLLAGVAVTVGVAWGSALSDPNQLQVGEYRMYLVPGQHGVFVWVRHRALHSDYRYMTEPISERLVGELLLMHDDILVVASRDELPFALRRLVGPVEQDPGVRRIVIAKRRGWPMRAIESSSIKGEPVGSEPLAREVRGVWRATWLPGSPELPIAPVWPGLIVNTLFYAIIVFALSLLPGAVRRWRRARRGLCVGCGYDLTGAGDACPECGRRAAGAEESPRA